MSYEGTEQYICPVGHAWNVDVAVLTYGEDLDRHNATHCPKCKRVFAFNASIDETNGYYPDVPETFEAPVDQIGYYDEPHNDHRGNHYFTKVHLVKPAPGSRWRPNEDLPEAERVIPMPGVEVWVDVIRPG